MGASASQIITQIPFKLRCLERPSRYKVLFGGRGSAKSWGISRRLIRLALESKIRILCAREFQNSIKDSSKAVIEDQIELLGYSKYFFSTKDEIRCLWTGSVFLFTGLARNISSIKSKENINICWCEEANTLSQESIDVLIPTVRADGSEIWFSFNRSYETDPIDQMFLQSEVLPPRSIITEINYYDNPFFPDVLREQMEHDKKTNFNKYLHVWEGKHIMDCVGALWDLDMIRKAKALVISTPKKRVIVAIDPAVTNNKNSDETGIIAATEYAAKFYSIDEDVSGVYSTDTWAQIAINMYHRIDADAIVVEVNQGGDLVENVLRLKGFSGRIINVRASKGKFARAEPISALYEQGKVHHKKGLAKLESQYMTYVPRTAKCSPDRLDAAVWALTELSSNTEIYIG